MEPLSLTVPDACRAIGLGRTKLYELIESGQVETIKIGARTLVKYDSLKRLIAGSEPVKAAA